MCKISSSPQKVYRSELVTNKYNKMWSLLYQRYVHIALGKWWRFLREVWVLSWGHIGVSQLVNERKLPRKRRRLKDSTEGGQSMRHLESGRLPSRAGEQRAHKWVAGGDFRYIDCGQMTRGLLCQTKELELLKAIDMSPQPCLTKLECGFEHNTILLLWQSSQ